ncbi:MAG: hypothetical protein NC302_02745 [Bacteroidales bacterium]|nr:hypothetical protein [Bacteroidales bacterium]MCM1414632.1 serine/threonine protein phosphatase [bacterium]MCM1423897.1 serine/threonine protein phosphatase [bacterium]
MEKSLHLKKDNRRPFLRLCRFYYNKYRHALPLLLYGLIYMLWFAWLEQNVTTTSRYHLIHLKPDDYIPFCEVFVVPYLLWFAYVAVVVLYFFFKDRDDYFRTCTFLFTGMTVFLIVSTLLPNGHDLRPAVMPRDNIFTELIAALYRTDTPTNLWPSIHVYNSLGCHFAVMKSARLEKKKGVRLCSFLLCSSIILSTVLIKQHSIFDVTTAFIMAAVMYGVVYSSDMLLNFYHSLRRRRRKAGTLI